jgi:hypothetical protein
MTANPPNNGQPQLGTAHIALAWAIVIAAVLSAVLRGSPARQDAIVTLAAVSYAALACGLIYLAATAAMHFRLGRAIRREGQPPPVPWLRWSLGHLAVLGITLTIMIRWSRSPAFLVGLEHVLGVLLPASVLSLGLLAYTAWWQRAHTDMPGAERSGGAKALWIVQLSAAVALVASLAWLHAAPLP